MIYYWCAGQDDNIGDVILRRRMLRSLQDAGPCAVYVGRATDDFIAALGIRQQDRIHTNFWRFVMTAAADSVRKDWLFAFNPGEIKCNRKQSIMHALLIPMMLISLVRGRRCIRIGVGVGLHDYGAFWRRLIWFTVRLAKVNVWRDAPSRDLFGHGTVAPDWAFDEGGDETVGEEELPERKYLAIALRADGPTTSSEWMDAVRSIAQRRGLTPTVVVQVKRDSSRARELAAHLNCDIVDWTDESHADQEKRLRYVYRRCEAVISDRLHVLVMALTEGAVPVGLMEHEDEKISRHFTAAGFGQVSWDVRGWNTDQIAAQGIAGIDGRPEIERNTGIARSRVRALDSVVRTRLSNFDSVVSSAAVESADTAIERTPSIHYLVGGFRISLGPESNTPGPRTHIVNFVRGLTQIGRRTELLIASSFPMMGRFTRIKQSDYAGVEGSKIWIADLVRGGAALWCGANVFARTVGRPAPELIYERVAVLQSLTSFHARKRSAVRVVEANGILSRETAQDRKVLKAERVARYLERRVLRRADLVVAVSARLRDELVGFAGIDPGKVLVVPNGVDERLLDYSRTSGGSRVIGFVGSVVKWQNLDQLILSVARVAASAAEPVRLEIIGDGAELRNLQELVREKDLTDIVTFHGRMAQADAFEVMTGWDIGIAGHQKSSSQSMYHSPLKLYEYAALGLTIVCTDSADAEALAVSGADVHMFSETAEFEDTLRQLVTSGRRSDDEIERSRATVVRDHAWSTRAAAVLERAGVSRPTDKKSTR